MALKNTNEMILKNLSSQERKQESPIMGSPFNIQINKVKLNEKKKTTPLDNSVTEEINGEQPGRKILLVEQKDS